MHQRAVGSTSSVDSVDKSKWENKSVAASPPMFKNKFLDSLTRVSPIEVFIIYTPTGIHCITCLFNSYSQIAIYLSLTCYHNSNCIDILRSSIYKRRNNWKHNLMVVGWIVVLDFFRVLVT